MAPSWRAAKVESFPSQGAASDTEGGHALTCY
jgi:hypothetical protein